MCLETTNATVHVAKRPIFCYKAGRIYGTKMGPFEMDTYYEEKVPAIPIDIEADLQEGIINTEVNIGYHSFNSYLAIRREFSSYRYGIFAIPPGAKYINGTYNSEKYKNRVSSCIVYICEATFWNMLKAKLGLLKIS